MNFLVILNLNKSYEHSVGLSTTDDSNIDFVVSLSLFMLTERTNARLPIANYLQMGNFDASS